MRPLAADPALDDGEAGNGGREGKGELGVTR
jgi:hypothetical protein